MEKLKVLPGIEVLVRLPGQLHCERIVMAVQDANLGNHFRVLDRWGEQFHLFSNMSDLLVNAILTVPLMIQHASIKFLRPDPWLAEKEIEDAARPARNKLVSKQSHDARSNEGIH